MSLDFNPEARTVWKEAINAVLLMLGREPIPASTTITDGQALDPLADAVRNTLDKVTKEVLSRGWHFNTVEITLTPVLGVVTLPDYILEFNAKDPQVAQLGSTLLNKRTNTTDDFSNPVSGVAVIGHDLVDCPEAIRQYIYCKAARQMAASYAAEVEFERNLEIEEARAWARVMSFERRTRNGGLLSNPGVAARAGYYTRLRRYH